MGRRLLENRDRSNRQAVAAWRSKRSLYYRHMSDATRLLEAMSKGDPHAAADLLPLVYHELRRLARSHMAQERAGHTLEATALVHEAYLRLIDGQPQHWDGRRHFFAAAAEAMRRILVEKARRRQRLRHGGGRVRLDLDRLDSVQLALDDCAQAPAEELLALDEALTRLAAAEPQAAEVVKLRFFAGLTIEQAAESLSISVRTANRHWAYAKAWLYQQLTERGDAPDEADGGNP